MSPMEPALQSVENMELSASSTLPRYQAQTSFEVSISGLLTAVASLLMLHHILTERSSSWDDFYLCVAIFYSYPSLSVRFSQ